MEKLGLQIAGDEHVRMLLALHLFRDRQEGAHFLKRLYRRPGHMEKLGLQIAGGEHVRMLVALYALHDRQERADLFQRLR